MKDVHNLPTKNKEFSAMKKALNDKQKKQNEKFLNLMNRFMYRYRMAKAFQTIIAEDVEKRTVDGYACGMKLFMAYSAYDEIRSAERILLKIDRNKTHKYVNDELAERIRKNKKMQDLLLETIAVEEDGLKIMLKKFYANKNSEIMIFASSLRHSFVHGDFTTARSGLTNKREIQTVNDVTEVVLKVSDDIFSEILTK
jgi:hypothetical protein